MNHMTSCTVHILRTNLLANNFLQSSESIFVGICIRQKGEHSPYADWSEIFLDKGWNFGWKIGLPAAGTKTNEIIAKHVPTSQV